MAKCVDALHHQWATIGERAHAWQHQEENGGHKREASIAPGGFSLAPCSRKHKLTSKIGDKIDTLPSWNLSIQTAATVYFVQPQIFAREKLMNL